MRIGLYQFASTDRIENNLRSISKAVEMAANAKVRLLAFHECALCGYPPVESKIESIKREEIEKSLFHISNLANKFQLYISVGTVRFEKNRRFNSIVLFDDKGASVGNYDKTALWGWDTDHFSRGKSMGVFEIDGIKIGFRICFDIRFPESFRELYKNNVNVCIVSFSDTSESADMIRYNIMKSHLITRAAENVMTVLSVNSISNHQTAPTAVFDQNGCVLKEAESDKEELLIFDYEIPDISFGMKGRIVNSDYFLNDCNTQND